MVGKPPRACVEKMRGGIGGGIEEAREIMAEVGPELLRKKTLGFEERSRGGVDHGVIVVLLFFVVVVTPRTDPIGGEGERSLLSVNQHTLVV